MGQTVVEKIAQAYMAQGPARPLRTGDFLTIRPKHILTHDNTSAVIKKFKAIGATKVHDARQPVFALDHDIQNKSEDNLKKYAAIEAFAREHGIDFFPAGSGIGHQIMCERGYVTPGSFVVASDSHSNMYGALGAVGTPIVRTDAAAVWATGEFWWQIPRTVQVVLEGELGAGVSGKDVIIALCGLYPDEVLNAAVEFSGPGVKALSMDARLTIANMSTEWGALVAWFPCDEVTIEWLRAKRAARIAHGEAERYTKAELQRWAANPVVADAGAQYAARITFDLSEVEPCVSGPDTVQVMTSVSEIAAKNIQIHKAYLLSCTNARMEDLEAAAHVVRGKKVASTVKLYVAAASARVQEMAEQRGVWKTLIDAGAIALPPGCGPCIGMGAGLLEPGEVGISATNRNFKGRMGSRDAQCYLASPAVVAASAVAGFICRPVVSHQSPAVRDLRKRFEAFAISAKAENVEILPGFPDRVHGRLVFLNKDNLNTDGIYAGSYTYRDDMTPEMMAGVVFDNYDPELPKLLRGGDVIVGGANFGTGSSREQAVTALKSKGIPLVIASSFSQTYLRNAFNNGFLCIEQAELVDDIRRFASGKYWIPGEEIDVDFTRSVVTWRCDEYRFPSLGAVPQSLVIAGGVENVVRDKISAKEEIQSKPESRDHGEKD